MAFWAGFGLASEVGVRTLTRITHDVKFAGSGSLAKVNEVAPDESAGENDPGHALPGGGPAGGLFGETVCWVAPEPGSGSVIVKLVHSGAAWPLC